jgi:RNA polymerase primary sigma factor
MSDFTFESAAWELALEDIQAGSTLSAVQFLTLMEGEEETVVEDALQLLEQRDILLDVSQLPKVGGMGEAALRLRREEQLVESGTLLESLEETDPLRLYLEELAQIPVCGDVRLLSERLLEGDKSVAQQLTDLMLSRVVERAGEMVGRGVLLLDLIQEGSLGLWQAVLNYEGGDFESWCDRKIRWDLARAVTMQARNNGVGQKLRQAMEDYRAVDERLLSELGRNPTLEEIADQLHMSVEETAAVAKNLDAARVLARAKTVAQPEEEDPEEQQAVEDTAYFQMRQRIAELLSELDDEGKKLLTLRFGLEGGKPLTPEQAGQKLGLTAEEVVKKEAAALAKLRTIG